jgi:hypothetical protein
MVMKNFEVIIIACILFFASSLHASEKEITIDSTFFESTEIFPFTEIQTITGLRFSGDIILHHDTSLVRLIYVDNDGNEFMIYEAYPLILNDLEINVKEGCDETCFLEQRMPYSVKIQIIDAELTLESFFYDEEPVENPPAMQYATKRATDAEKIEMMNDRISQYGMNWTAGDNDIVERYYFQKKQLFGEGYNLLGYEYYQEGVFEYLDHAPYQNGDPELVWRFDWRERHGANTSTSPYWDSDTLGTGWLTSVKNQGLFPGCYAFGAAGVTEALANLYCADHLDYDLSEEDLLSCYDCGSDGRIALAIVKDTGIVTEDCLPYYENDTSCKHKCETPDVIISISDT